MPTAPKINYNKYELPSDINQKLGALNLLFIDGFSKVRSVSSVFFKRTFSIHEGLFDEVDPLARKVSNDIQTKLYERSQRSIFDSERKKIEINKKPTLKEKQKALGKLSMVFIDIVSGTEAFTEILFKRFSTQYDGLFEEANRKSAEFSYNTSMKLYNSAIGRFDSSKKVNFLESSKPKLPKVKVEEIVRKPLNITKNESEVLVKPHTYKRTAFVIALIGVVVLLAYYVFPIFQLEMEGELKTEIVRKRGFFMWNNTEPYCYDRSDVFIVTPDGKREPYLIIDCSSKIQMIKSWTKYIPISCTNLTFEACKEKCMNIKRSIFG